MIKEKADKILGFTWGLLPFTLTCGFTFNTNSIFNKFSEGTLTGTGSIGFAILMYYLIYRAKRAYTHKDVINLYVLPLIFILALGVFNSGAFGKSLYLFATSASPYGYAILVSLTLAVAYGQYYYWRPLNLMAQRSLVFREKERVEEERLKQIELDTLEDEKEDQEFYDRMEKETQDFLKKTPKDFIKRNTKPSIPKYIYKSTYKEKPIKKIKPIIYKKPSLEMLRSYSTNPSETGEAKLKGEALIKLLKSFKIQTELDSMIIGATITTYRLKSIVGMKYTRITNLNKEIQGALQAESIRIQAPIPGTDLIGIEAPNKTRSIVSFKESMESINSKHSKTTVVIGKDNMGKLVNCDLAKMPHLLVAGTTGSGKSVTLQAMIASLLMRNLPKDVQLALIDPKQSEFSCYEGLPHLWSPIVYNDPDKAESLLEKLVEEMENRYKKLAKAQCKNIKDYLDKGFRMPYIILFIEEFADLKMSSKKVKGGSTFEFLLCRIAQKARACGIHAIIATQRPSVDIVSGLIKANFPSAIACKVRSHVDSKVILEEIGAESLIGNGDLLYKPSDSSCTSRIQGAFIRDEEIKSILRCYNV